MSHQTLDHMPPVVLLSVSVAFLLTQADTIRKTSHLPIICILLRTVEPDPGTHTPVFLSLCRSLCRSLSSFFFYLALSSTNTHKQTELRSSTYLGLILIKPTHRSIMLLSSFQLPQL